MWQYKPVLTLNEIINYLPLLSKYQYAVPFHLQLRTGNSRYQFLGFGTGWVFRATVTVHSGGS
jgi:hypothetical protein